jgi:hypothetical protein
MRASGRGWICNISSRAAGPKVGLPFAKSQAGAQIVYGSTKAMLDRITTGSAMELYDVAVLPGVSCPKSVSVLDDEALDLVTLEDGQLPARER